MAAAELLDVGAIVERAIELPPEPAEREHMRRVSMDLICVAQVPSAAGEVHRC